MAPTAESLTQLGNEIKDKADEIKKIPDALNDKLDEVRWKLPGAYLLASKVRDDMQDGLKALITSLEELIEGLFAPALFIEYGAAWLQVAGRAGLAVGHLNDPKISLEGQWEGNAYSAYKESRASQSAAAARVNQMCQDVNAQLLAISSAGRDLYVAVINKLATLLAQISVAVIESATVVGFVWSINTFNDAIVTCAELVAEVITNTFKEQAAVQIAANQLEFMINHPAGFVPDSRGNDHWPSTVKDRFDSRDDDWKKT
ncbi:hypothetical protein [Nocardia farcinica]|uniref:hypothetical protein n=1 Tax=Nocardia farcinica TaxID=37329 RepID=UPI0024552B54|nr:hypothetical protein [Nocardia farcinica]